MLLWGPILFFTKLALLLLYYRLFRSSRALRHLIYAGIVFHFLLYALTTVLSAVLCRRTFVSSCVVKFDTLVIVASALNISGDFYLLFLPILAVARLHIPGSYKLGLVVIFSVGLL